MRHMTPVAAAARFINSCPENARVLIAVSGGSDSTGLLFALHDSAQKLKRRDISLFAATIDHALRPGSDAEAQTIAKLCETLNIPHQIAKWLDEKPTTGIPAAARLARYHLLSGVASDVSATCIVTGHTLNDQQETIAMRADRSTPDSIGLSGMADAMLFNRQIWVARPFLEVDRADIRNYLRDRNVSWVDDPTNVNDAYERARVRKALANAYLIETDGGMDQAARCEISESVAAFVARYVEVLDQLVAVVDRKACQSDPSGPRAIAILLAVMGGRSHRPGRDAMAKLMSVLHSDANMTLTLSRSVITFRKDSIFITRELRDLPELRLGAGQSGSWDNRFFIQNRSDDTLTVCCASDNEKDQSYEMRRLPKAVAQRAHRSRPHIDFSHRIAETDPKTENLPNLAQTIVEPIFPMFDLFLPIFDLPVANCVSQLFGRSAFPAFPIHYM